MWKRIILVTTWLAGMMDASSGLLLASDPAMALGVMGIQVPVGDLVFVRFIGAFVFAVGGSYLIGLYLVKQKDDWCELKTIWMITAWIRMIIAVFTTGFILSGSLGAEWLGVPLTDGVLSVFQVYCLWTKKFPTRH